LKTLFSFYIFFFFRKVLSGKKAKHKEIYTEGKKGIVKGKQGNE
jgi:hypothetical protein